MYPKPELLSPAGDFDALIAAVQNGADAVYLGGKGLNARRGAGNFDREEMKKAADYLHERGKKLYVTVNTMVKQTELPLLYETAECLAYAGADAAIVQDFGVCGVLSSMLPSLRLHASTQMAVHNVQGAIWLKERGFERAVLAREMSYDEIAACREAGIETEVFCHGALCVACSGQCLFSSLVGGRSGNRGACAQPCRLPYTLEGARDVSGYLLSPRDLMTAGEMDRMRESGVSSLKIEGRLKRPEYVAVVTGIYRRLLDGERFTEEDLEKLKQIFNRGGFTGGYASGIRDGEFISSARPSHWGVQVGTADTPGTIRLTRDVIASDSLVIRGKEETPVKLEGLAGRTVKNPARKTGSVYRMVSEAQMLEARESMRGEHACVNISARLVLKPGLPAFAEVSDGQITVTVTGDALETSQKAPADAERIRAQFSKTGGTPYTVKGLDIDCDPAAFVPVSVINSLRRECLERLSAERIDRARICESETVPYAEPPVSDTSSYGRQRVTVQGSDAVLLRKLLSAGADDAVYFSQDLRSIPDISGMFLYLPPVMAAQTLEKLHGFAQGAGIRGVYITNPGQMQLSWPGETRYDFALNLANIPALGFLGINNSLYTPSIELTVGEINRLPGRKELIVYGRVPLMHLRHCPLNAARNGGRHLDCRVCDNAACGKKLDDCHLKDRMNAVFPLKRLASGEGCVIDLMNSVPINLAGHFAKLPRCESVRLIFTDEDNRAASGILKAYISLINGEKADLSLLPKDYTTGHYFRGVE